LKQFVVVSYRSFGQFFCWRKGYTTVKTLTHVIYNVAATRMKQHEFVLELVEHADEIFTNLLHWREMIAVSHKQKTGEQQQ